MGFATAACGLILCEVTTCLLFNNQRSERHCAIMTCPRLHHEASRVWTAEAVDNLTPVPGYHGDSGVR